MSFFARLDRPNGQVELHGETWNSRFPVSALANWIDFYQRMSARQPGSRGQGYRDTVSELKRVQKALEKRPL